jgi:hypothetical protein
MEHHHLHKPPQEPSAISSGEIYKAAEAHAKSYAEAARLGSKDIAIPQIAKELHKHYGASFTAFSLGNVLTIPSGSDGAKGIETHLERFEKSGLGLDLEMTKLRVEVVSLTSAVCWVTWRLRPKKEGVAPWEWTNLYGYRQMGGMGKGYWEWAVSDQEIGGLVLRVPDFFEL